MTTYAITGATGQFGTRAIEELLTRGVPADDVVAVVRTPQKATALAARGVVVREGDYDRPDTLSTALAGVDRLLFVSGTEVGRRVEQHTAVVSAAQGAGLQRIAYTSLLKADISTIPFVAEDRQTEEALVESRIPVTLLRNAWYNENYTGNLTEYLTSGEILGCAGAGRVSGASREDLAVAAVVALLSDEGGDVVYELGGPAYSLADLAAVITKVSGTTVKYSDLTPEDFASMRKARGADAEYVDLLVAIDSAIAGGELETDGTDLEQLLGRPPTPLAETVRMAVA
jgi:NAD(P)H dehydrogenase (quinone)